MTDLELTFSKKYKTANWVSIERRDLKKQSQFQGKAKVKRQKVKMRVNPEFLRRGYLKKQSQYAGLWPEIRSTKL